MDCNIIKDLLPVYTSGKCSAESSTLVEEHLRECGECAADLSRLQQHSAKKASAFHYAVMALCVAVAAVGLALEAASKEGILNGYWFVLLTISAGAVLAAAAGWFFGGSRKALLIRSLVIALALTALAYAAVGLHYDLAHELWFHIPAVIALPAVINIEACAAAVCLAGKYAKLSGID